MPAESKSMPAMKPLFPWRAVGGTAFLFLCSLTTAHGERLPLPAPLQAKVNQTIDRGIAFLFQTQGIWGTWTANPKNHPVSYAALPGLTLLECGEPNDHPVIQRAATFVRETCVKLDTTYDLSLAILFLDRLGDPADEKLIQTLALRLIAGQTFTGGWSYRCPVLGAQQSQQLLAMLRLKSTPSLSTYWKNQPAFSPPSSILLGEPSGKSRDIRGTTDNSNTQFATLALWAAQRHAVPMERNLTLIAVRFNTSQNSDGSWGYHYRYGGGDAERPAMTCVGLLGLAIGHGLAADKEMSENLTFALARAQAAAVLAFHPQFSFLLLALERAEKREAFERAKKRGQDPRILHGFLALNKHVGEPVERMEAIPQKDLYFMWSLERVAVLYDLPTIGPKDWYRWGAEMLVANQQAAGNWDNGGYPGADPILDTCLALLFLKRANLVAELTTKLPLDPNDLTSSINAQLAPSGLPSSPTDRQKGTVVTAESLPAKTWEAETGVAAKAQSAVSLSQPESSLVSEETETRGRKGWLWLLVVLAAVLFVACGILLASYSLARGHKRKRPRTIRYAKNRSRISQRTARYSKR
jgi:hypothetical protein